MAHSSNECSSFVQLSAM